MRCTMFLLVAVCIAIVGPARGQEMPKEFKGPVKKGIAWLVKQQKADGSWPSPQGSPAALTGLAGLALLMEGSTAGAGDHADSLNRAAEWFMRNCQKGNDEGLLVNRQEPGTAGRYMFDHGYGMLFLACAVTSEERRITGKSLKDRIARERLKEYQAVLKRAVGFTVKAQSSQGGWFYTSSTEGHDSDEGAPTLVQVQALRAAKQAGVEVPKETMRKAMDYVEKSTSPRGILYNSFASRSERSTLTAAAIVCAYGPDERDNESVKNWLKHCDDSNYFTRLPVGALESSFGLFYSAQVMHGLGEKGYEKLLVKAKKGMQWSEYRKKCLMELVRTQAPDGSWAASTFGPVYETSVSVFVLQLDKEAVPFFRGKKDR